MASPATAFVRRIVQDHGPLSAKEIYRMVKATPASSASSSQSGGSELASARTPKKLPSSDLLVPSMSFLKKHVLSDLKSSPMFELKHVRRPIVTPSSSQASAGGTSAAGESASAPHVPSVSAWVWRVIPAEDLQKREHQVESQDRRKTRPDPLKYDAASDRLSLSGTPSIEHMSRRRQKARVRKDHVERMTVKDVEKSRVSAREAPSV